MSNVIDFLERFGRDAELRHASDEAVAEALKEAGIDPAVRGAIVSKDQGELERLLGSDTNVCCLIHSPDDDEEKEEDDELDEDDEDDEDEDEDEDEDDDDDEDEDEDEEAELDSVPVSHRPAERVA